MGHIDLVKEITEPLNERHFQDSFNFPIGLRLWHAWQAVALTYIYLIKPYFSCVRLIDLDFVYGFVSFTFKIH